MTSLDATSLGLVAAGLGGAGLSFPTAAQAGWLEGTHYVRLQQPAAVTAVGKVEVVEFFWYECPPATPSSRRSRPGRRSCLPTSCCAGCRYGSRRCRSPPAASFYTLEALGLAPTLHRKVFAASTTTAPAAHPRRHRSVRLTNGTDPIRFMTVYSSPEVAARCQQAKQLAEAYKIDAVPAMGVQGRFYTNGNLANAGQPAKGPAVLSERLLGVVDMLLGRVRKTG
jgi:thiol:disulfide interchange protein DsbA